MSTYIRFQIPARYTTSAWPLGIFRSLDWLDDEASENAHLLPWIDEALAWFNIHLTVPSRDDYTSRALFWFRPEASDHVAQAWSLTFALREAGIAVQLCRTRCPGRIVYRDPHQIAAIPYWPYHRSYSTHISRTFVGM